MVSNISKELLASAGFRLIDSSISSAGYPDSINFPRNLSREALVSPIILAAKGRSTLLMKMRVFLDAIRPASPVWSA